MRSVGSIVATILPAVAAIAVFGAATLNLRHLVMGAVLRPRLGGSRLRRAALTFFLLDETFGFAVAAGDLAEREGQPAGPARSRPGGRLRGGGASRR